MKVTDGIRSWEINEKMYQLRWLEKRGKELMAQGIIEDSFRCANVEEMEG